MGQRRFGPALVKENTPPQFGQPSPTMFSKPHGSDGITGPWDESFLTPLATILGDVQADLDEQILGKLLFPPPSSLFFAGTPLTPPRTSDCKYCPLHQPQQPDPTA